MHEKLVITPPVTSSSPSTKLRNWFKKNLILPSKWKKCAQCNNKKEHCRCTRTSCRRNGVFEQHLASVGEPVITSHREVPAALSHHHHLHHHQSPPPPSLHHPHLTATISRVIPTHSFNHAPSIHSTSSDSLYAEPYSPSASPTFPSPALRGVPRGFPLPQDSTSQARSGVRRPGVGGTAGKSPAPPPPPPPPEALHHQGTQQPLTTTTTTTATSTTSTSTSTMPGSGAGVGGGEPHLPPLPPPPTTTLFLVDSNNLLNNNNLNNNHFNTSSSSSNTNTSSTSSSSNSSRCPPQHLDLHDYSGDGTGDDEDEDQDGDDDHYQTGSGDGSECEPCHIQLDERLLKSNPIWYLPDLQRSGAVHLLQGKDEGTFIVRQSSKPDTLALSVRLPEDKGPYIQHYLIEIHNDSTSYSLEASENKFDTLPSLITYYSQCCDELPVELKLPRSVQEAKTRHELTSLALLGQEFWGTPMASPTASTPTADCPRSALPTPSPRPHDLSFSSFGKGGVTRGISSTSLLSPQTPGSLCVSGGSLTSSVSGSTSSLAPARPAPPVPSPADRSCLNLNLAPLDEILQEQPILLSFRSQPATPVNQLKPSTPSTKPTPPPRSSPPGQQRTNMSQISPSGSQRPFAKPTPPTRFSPQTSGDAGTPSSDNGDLIPRQTQAPVPPPRWARSSYTSSPSNITVTTTLSFNVNQPMQAEEYQQGMTLHIANLEISPQGSSSPQSVISTTPNGNQSGTLNGYRDGLQLHIRQQITSPQSTPCTPCAPSTPISEDNGIVRGRMRSCRKDKRRHSNHYHEANIIDSNSSYCRSSLADKISDYEDLWSSPPRELPSTPTSAQPKMSTFKPRNEISKSMGDLSEIAKNTKPVHFNNDSESPGEDEVNGEGVNGNSTDSVNSYRKNASPFYMEPADALREQQPQARINKASNKLSRKVTNRYSDSNIQWKPRKSHNSLGKIDSNEDLPFSSSIENLANGRNSDAVTYSYDEEKNKNIEREKNKVNAGHLVNGHAKHESRRQSRLGGRGKPIAPPRIGHDSVAQTDNQNEVTGHVSSSWEFQGCESDDGPSGEARFPVSEAGESDSVIIPGDKTVQDLISEKLPDLPLDAHSLAPSCTTRISEYDNVGCHNGTVRDENPLFQNQKLSSRFSRHIPLEERIHPPLPTHYFSSTVSESGTEFSEPWDSRKWESLMHFEDDSSVDQYPRSLTETPAQRQSMMEDSDLGGIGGVTDTDSFIHVAAESAVVSDDETASLSGTPTLSLAHAHNLDTQQRSRIMSPQLLALRHRQDVENGAAIKTYAMDLGSDTTTTFSRAVSNFLTCTLESPERDPAIVTRNVRQFMSGMKNYLVTSGEKEFEAIVKGQQSTLKCTEFLNLDAILEDVLVRLVLRPLWTHINKLFVDAFSANGQIQLLAMNMKYARSQPYIRLGIRAELSPPSGSSLETIRSLLTRMQKVYAPREKLESLLATISHIYQAMYENRDASGCGDADDLVPMIMWVLSQSQLVSAEVEAEYMWGLLLPSASSGEASYYLEAFHSAIHALKNLSPSPEPSPGNSLDSVKQDMSVVSDQGIMKILIPDEKNGSIVTRTLPIRPATTTREVCKMMAHKMRVTNPQDYGLYKLVDGLETLLSDNECPHKVKSDLTTHGFHCTFAFKRIDAKIAWPILS